MRFSLLFSILVVLVAPSALAQRVVILELDGDPQGKLRAQIEGAVKAAGEVELVSLKTFKETAAKRRLKGGAAMTPVGVSRSSKLLKLDAAVGGAVSGGAYQVLIYDRAGEQLWAKSLPVKKGLLTDDVATKLARAIGAAAVQGAAKPVGTTPEVSSETSEETPEVPRVVTTRVAPPEEKKNQADNAEPVVQPEERDVDLDLPAKPRRKRLPVPLIRGWLGAAMNWRTQCLRPGSINSCKEYDTAKTQPFGVAIDFNSSLKDPSLGLSANVEVFPLAFAENRILQGFGILAGVQWAQSQTRILDENRTLRSDDIGFSVHAAWRFYFQMGLGDPLPLGFVGLRGGIQSRQFLLDPAAGTSLPSSDRTLFPAIGLDATIPVASFLAFDGSFLWFFSPKPGAEQIVGYGSLDDPTGGVVSSGFGLEFGVSGQIWGPLGYVFHWRYQGFHDRYYGEGNKWIVCNDTQCGGVAEESFHTIIIGLTGKY